MSEQDQNLSTDEMAALRDIAQPEAPQEQVAAESAKVKVSSYNFRQPGRLSAPQLRALKVVHEFFVKSVSEGAGGSPKVPFELSFQSVETVSYSNFMGSLGNPCFMMQLSSRFEQSVLLEVDLPSMRALASQILGVASAATEEDPAECRLTSIEQAIAGNWLEGLLPVLGESWALSGSVDFALKSIECDPRFVQVMPDDHPVVSVTFRITIGQFHGQLTICYPLESLQELLEGMSLKMSGVEDEDVGKEEGGARILASLKSVPFELRAELGCCTVKAHQLAMLKTGDVLCLDRLISDPIDVLLGNNQVFAANLGRKGDARALQISARRSES